MGNSFGGRKTTKVMKIDGETMKFKTPIVAGEILKNYPGFVILESESVKNLGLRAKPLEESQELKPRRLYFLVELPKSCDEKAPRRVRSAINMSAKDRLESLLLSRRSISDLTLIKPQSLAKEEVDNGQVGVMRLRLPKSEVVRLVKESKDTSEAAQKIVQLASSSREGEASVDGESSSCSVEQQWTPGLAIIEETCAPRKKRVGFLPIQEVQVI